MLSTRRIPFPGILAAALLAPRDGSEGGGSEGGDSANPPEIDLSQYMPKAVFEKELARRVAAIVGKQTSPDDLLQDEAFRAKAIETWGLKPAGEDGGTKGGITTEQLTAAQKEWEKKHLTPLQERATAAEAKVQKLLQRDLHAQILQAAGSLGVKKAFLTAPVAGGTPPIVNFLSAYFGLDEESGAWFLKDGDGFAFSATPSKDSPYKTVEEFLAEWTEGAGKDFLEEQGQRGAGLRNPGGPKGKQDINAQIAEAEAKGDFATANRLKAEKLRSL